MKKLLVLALLVMGTQMVGCPGKSAPTDYFPLAVGDKWEYDYTWRDSTVKGDSVTVGYMREYLVIELVDTAKLDDGQVVFVRTNTVIDSLTQFTMVDTDYVCKKDDSLFVFPVPFVDSGFSVSPLDLPVGLKWDSGLVDSCVVEPETTVTVPAGTYSNCIVIRGWFDGSTTWDSAFSYRAPDVGLVKSTDKSIILHADSSKSTARSDSVLTKFTKKS